MKELFVVLSLLISLSCYAKKIYTIPKDEFITQFSDTAAIERVYCYKKDGEKVWLIVSNTTILILKQNDGKEKKLILKTIKYKNGLVEAAELSAWGLKYQVKTFDLKDILSIEVEGTINERVIAYFNDDSCKSVRKFRNDSLLNSYATDSQYIVHLVIKKSSDTLTLLENACYHLKFKDSNTVEYGVVQKITPDSIYISNRFNRKAAEVGKVEYKIYAYLIKDISEVRLLHSGGFYYKKKNADEWNVAIVKEGRSDYHPCWFAKYQYTCEINFVRLWLTNNGFRIVFESGGKIYWYDA